MARARLVRLTLKAFRSFVEPTTVEFPENGLLLFIGPSGVGKSTLLLALTHVFGFCPYPSTALQSWLTEEPMSVSVELRIGDDDVTITRGQKLTLEVNGQRIQGSAKDIEKQIQQRVGLSAEMLAALTYRGQRRPGLFLSKTDAEKKEFLTQVLHLDEFEAALEKSAAKLKSLEMEVGTHQGILERLRAELEASELVPVQLQDESPLRVELKGAQDQATWLEQKSATFIERLRKSKAAINEEAKLREEHVPQLVADIEHQIAELEASPELDASQQDQSELVRLTSLLKQGEVFLGQEKGKDEARAADQRARHRKASDEVSQLKSGRQELKRIDAQLATFKTDLSSLEGSVCPTCDQQWSDAAKKASEVRKEMGRLEVRGNQILSEQQGYDAAVALMESLAVFSASSDLLELQSIVNGLRTDVATETQRLASELRTAKAERRQQIAELRTQVQTARAEAYKAIQRWKSTEEAFLMDDESALEELQQKLSVTMSQIKGTEGALRQLELTNAREQERSAQVEARRKALLHSIAGEQTALVAADNAIKAEKDFQHLIGSQGFLGTIFDEVLAEISDEATRMLSMFPNTSHVTLTFKSESATKAGTLKKSIVPVVSVGGHEAPLSSGLSGGMASVAELAVDLAVAGVVARRAGSSPQWLILDESFEGFGTREKEACMDILRSYGEEGLVLVVDHATEFQQMFNQFVTVNQDGGRSRVEAS